MFVSIALVALIGLCLSLYGYLVEKKMAAHPSYKPSCDISDRISCSKAFKSRYGSFMNVSNTAWGILFYSGIVGLALAGLKVPLVVASAGATGLSLVFAYLLIAKVKTFCPVCISIYVVNIVLFVLCLRAWLS